MIITDVSLEPYEIPYRTCSSWTPDGLDHRTGMLVIIRAENGRIGVGETAPLKYFSPENLSKLPGLTRSALDHLSGIDIPLDFRSLKDLMERIVTDRRSRCEDLPPSTHFGIETALADLASKTAEVPLAQWLNPSALHRVPVNAIITGSTQDLEQNILTKKKMGFPAYKIKVGRDSLEEDLWKIAVARDKLGEHISIRIDANRAWNFDQAVEALNRFNVHRIEYVEEPLQDHLLSRLPELHERCGVDIALDETVRQGKTFERLLESRAIHTVIIKPSIVGGISKSLALSRKISSSDRKFVFTSLVESGIGLTACLHIAAATGREIPPCGFDTLGCLSDSLIDEDLPVRDGFMEVPGKRGLGVTLKRGFLPT